MKPSGRDADRTTFGSTLGNDKQAGLSFDYLIAKANHLILHLTELRTVLISAAVTGKIDVRGEAA